MTAEDADGVAWFGLDREHVAVIGRVAVAFGHIEWLTSLILFPMIGSEGWAGRIVASGQTLNWQLSRIQALAPLRLDEELATEVAQWLPEVREAATGRNRVLHNAWHRVEDTERLEKLGYRSGQWDDHESSLDELHAFSAELGRLVYKTFNLMMRTTEALWGDVLAEGPDAARRHTSEVPGASPEGPVE